MRSPACWRLAVGVTLGILLSVNQLELNAFAQDSKAVAPAIPPFRSEVRTASVQIPTGLPVRTPAPTAKQDTKKRGSLKWILIAAAGAGVAAAVLAKGKTPPPPPPVATITVGQPGVGEPQ